MESVPPPLPPADLLGHLERAGAEFDTLLDGGDLAAPVPSCPGWSLLDLAHHVGGVHRWARTAVVEKRPSEMTVPGAPTERQELVAWFREGLDALLATLRDTAPEAECWTFGPRPRTAGFWFRRQPHETAMHLWDARTSQGPVTGPAFDAALAVDGIDEVVHLFVPRQIRQERIPPLQRSLAIEAAEGGRWMLAGDCVAPRSGTAGAEAVVRGPADVLLLLLWKRVGPDDPRLEIGGDERAAKAVLAAALTP